MGNRGEWNAVCRVGEQEERGLGLTKHSTTPFHPLPQVSAQEAFAARRAIIAGGSDLHRPLNFRWGRQGGEAGCVGEAGKSLLSTTAPLATTASHPGKTLHPSSYPGMTFPSQFPHSL